MYEDVDPLASLEDTKGMAFLKAVQKEDVLWLRALKGKDSQIQKWKTLFQTYQSSANPESIEYAFIRCKWQDRVIFIQPGAAGYTYNVWITDSQKRILWHKQGLSGFEWDPAGPFFCTLRDVGKGAEHIQIKMFQWLHKPVFLWKRDPVGPSVAFHKNRFYYLGVENALRYHQVWITDIKTGNPTRLLFTEKDKRVQLSLQQKGSTLFLHSANALFQKVGTVSPSGIQWLTPILKSTLIPLTTNWIATNHALQNLKTSQQISFPPHSFLENASQGPEKSMFLTTVQNGRTILWFLKTPTDTWIPLLQPEGLSEIEICHFQTENPTFILKRPHEPATVFEFRVDLGVALLQTGSYPAPLKLQSIAEGLAGAEKVPYVVVSAVSTSKPTKLIVSAYGAYGMSAQRSYPVRWLPYLAEGYAFAYVCPRGGREKGDAWYDGGRTALRKHHTFEDTAVAIQAIQTQLQISASRTLFFGRSAGGWLAAHIAQEYGRLVAGVYAEVPYVDVLRTTMNPKLPLTQLEYDEFGDPQHRPAEFRALQRISPVDTVPPYKKGISPRIVIRTGINDMQVLPYEALKWAIRLRERGWQQVFVGIDHDGGHFAAASDMNAQRAQDAVLLDAVTNGLKAVTRRSAGRRTKGRATRRRVTSSRKH